MTSAAAMDPEPIAIPIDHPSVDSIPGRVHRPASGERGSAVLLAHGAGAPMESPFLVTVAGHLCERGFGVLRFDYPYMERARREERRRPPDPTKRLEAAHRAALERARELFRGKRILCAGKSMGGRIGTHLAAQGSDIDGLCLLGYPLHAPGKPERKRDEHFAAIAQPALFLQGTRDALGRAEMLSESLVTFGGQATLSVVEGADHDFRVLKKLGRSRDEVLADLAARIDDWEQVTFPS